MGSRYFFIPRIVPESYQKGFQGYRTLVIGVFHVCTLQCPYKKDCLENSSRFDTTCPCYKEEYANGNHYLRLSNSNQIEVDSFLEGSARYPEYTVLSRFLLSEKRHIEMDENEQLWNSIAFTNYLQRFKGAYSMMKYVENKEEFDRDFASFEYLLDEIRPEVIYVFDDSVKDCLNAHLQNVPGLKFIKSIDCSDYPLFLYTYKITPKASPCQITDDFASRFKKNKNEANFYASLVPMLNAIKEREGLEKYNKEQINYLRPHIWDEALIDYLYRTTVELSLGDKQLHLLKEALSQFYKKGWTIDEEHLLFDLSDGSIASTRKEWERTGLIVELIKLLNGVKKLSDNFYLHYFGYSFTTNSWRDRKKEYNERERSRLTLLNDILK